MPKLKYTFEVLKKAVDNSRSFRQTVINLGATPCGGSIEYITKKILKFKIDCSHFKGCAWNRGNVSNQRKKASEILILYAEGSSRQRTRLLRRALLDIGIPYLCNSCSISEWRGKKINLEINHIDGRFINCLPDNLEFLCPNCHSQTPKYKNYRG